MKPVYVPVLKSPLGFSLRELARDTAELGAITALVWAILKLTGAL